MSIDGDSHLIIRVIMFLMSHCFNNKLLDLVNVMESLGNYV
jgi:hypothetical protein